VSTRSAFPTGRNFEYYSEDPVVAGEIAASMVGGIQSEGVVATTKHHVANNQERDRYGVSAEVDERTLRELYLRPFRRPVEAGTGAVMTAYNRVNGTHMSDHRRLVTEILGGEWGFEGFVVSDWHGTESTVGAATGGLDLEMPGVPDVSRGGLFGEPLAEAIESGAVPGTRLDDMVERVLGTMERFGLLDDTARDAGAVDTPAHRALAERIAVRGTVLLENDGVLPLSEGTDVALIGPHVHEATVGGGGSSEITPLHRTSPREGIEARAGESVTVARGVTEIESVSLFEELPFDFGDEDEPRDETGPAPTVSEAVTAAAGRADVSVVFVRDAATRGPGPREPRTARRAGRTGRRGGGCRRPNGRRRLQRGRRAPGARRGRRGARSVVPRSGGRPGHRLGPLRRRGPVGTVARHLRPRSGLPDDRPATVSRCRR
jgi:beta-glucosidase